MKSHECASHPTACRPLIRRDDELRVEQRCPARPPAPAARRRLPARSLARRERRLGLAAPVRLVPPRRRRARHRLLSRGRHRARRRGAGPRPRLRRCRHRRDDRRPRPACTATLGATEPPLRRPARAVRGLGRRPGRRDRLRHGARPGVGPAEPPVPGGPARGDLPRRGAAHAARTHRRRPGPPPGAHRRRHRATSTRSPEPPGPPRSAPR